MQYYYTQNGHQYGPFTLEELQQKSINKDTLIWRPGMEKWVGAGELAELSTIFPPIVPGLPPLPNNGYIPYHAPVTPKGDRSWIGIVAAFGLMVALVVFLVWRESNKSSAPVPAPTTDKTQLNKDSLDQVEREKEAQRINDELKRKEGMQKALQLLNWKELVPVKLVNVNVKNGFGGINSVTVEITNNLGYTIEWAEIWVQYIKLNGDTYTTQSIDVRDLGPGEKRVLTGPGAERGKSANCFINFIVVPEIGLKLIPADT